jgi:magnesium transporter
MDQEEVARLFRKYGMVSAPVVDEDGIVVGMITVDDVVDIIEEEADEDLLRLGGVAEQDFYSAIAETVKKRFPWLMVNLMTAMISASVIGMFQGSIQHLVVLAALMPVVASIGGNAGTQAMTVAVRALAGKELSNVNALRVIGKEMLVVAANGTLLAMIAGLVVVAWQGGDFGVASVFAIAVVINMAIAGLVGVLVPYSLSRVKIDPAISSGVFVTGTTDMMGFLVFLGLASLWLL